MSSKVGDILPKVALVGGVVAIGTGLVWIFDGYDFDRAMPPMISGILVSIFSIPFLENNSSQPRARRSLQKCLTSK